MTIKNPSTIDTDDTKTKESLDDIQDNCFQTKEIQFSLLDNKNYTADTTIFYCRIIEGCALIGISFFADASHVSDFEFSVGPYGSRDSDLSTYKVTGSEMFFSTNIQLKNDSTIFLKLDDNLNVGANSMKFILHFKKKRRR